MNPYLLTSRIPRPWREPADWQRAAACVGLPPSIVFARRERDALPALRACLRCPVRERCTETVAPAESWFDGVSGGRLWRNGRPVRLRILTATEAETGVEAA